ncbi:MAG: glycosyl hydrolase 115 family protein [Defluviitaleaceae bacterium]|nr:glycosyl hydrolase 115 family protein [Defluviitaleaceae bacterium]
MIKFIVEENAFLGVKKIANKVAKDFEKVSGNLPEILDNISTQNIKKDIAELKSDNSNVSSKILTETKEVLFATLGKSPLVENMIENKKFDSSEIKGKREVYQIKWVDNILIVVGSDKRGTIYGMFALSEFIGVSPLHFWGDAEPLRKNISLDLSIETISKEPSVKYRGFFINDEWPCFGTWTFSKFGGFTAEMYDHVFELLLRLKGNYLWPAMWTSSFALDGPGEENEKLADIYGIVIGASHHEPCLRASEEWDKVRGENSPYGNEWNYYTNKKGLLKYWEGGLKRSGKYEKIVTIGMRGERDSSMLGEEATVKDNVDLLKDIITNQRNLIKTHANELPQLLALYKEIEEYFYGNEEVQGLKDWDGLEDVILMFCEDNFGFTRTLPTEEVRNKKFGMYYHFDYHGGPVSYEWMPSTPYKKVWEQMSKAYAHGVKDVWIVNVGDLKFNEVPLSYFMDLAYDFEKWGENLNSVEQYIEEWFSKTFPVEPLEIQKLMAEVLNGYIKLNSWRRPEALNSSIYHPYNYLESDRILNIVKDLKQKNDEIYNGLYGSEKESYYSMIYLPAEASFNLIKMHIYSSKNMHYAEQGKKIANIYRDLVKNCIEHDKELFSNFAKFKNGKWKGMELEEHIGFTMWNDDNCRYPLRVTVEPFHKPRMVVSRADDKKIHHKTYGTPMTILIDDFLYLSSNENSYNSQVFIEVANDGKEVLNYDIVTENNEDLPTWLELDMSNNEVEYQEIVTVTLNREKLPKDEDNENKIQSTKFFITDGETKVAVEVKAKRVNINYPKFTFLENKGIITIDAHHFANKKDTEKGTFKHLKDYGRSGNGMKIFPPEISFNENEEKPSLTYKFVSPVSAEYIIELWTTPVNPVYANEPLRLLLEQNLSSEDMNNETTKMKQIITTVPKNFVAFHTDPNWSKGVMENIRKTLTTISLKEGLQELTISPLETGLILERILIYREENKPKASYLGPLESYFV